MENEIAGTDWTDAENDLIVADYFSMLADELAGIKYVKSEHNSALQKLTQRSRGSIERKHMNISAVLERLGLPRIKGYLPYFNFQNGLIAAIERHIEHYDLAQPDVAVAKSGFVAEVRSQWRGPNGGVSGLSSNSALLSEYEAPPSAHPDDHKSTDLLDRLVRKFDPAARDARNRALGKQGEQMILEIERHRLSAHGRGDLARRVQWTSQELGDGAGYDIASFAIDGSERLLEIKTTNGPARTPFFLSENERVFSEEKPQSFRVIRLYNFAQAPSAFELVPPLSAHLELRPTSYRALLN